MPSPFTHALIAQHLGLYLIFIALELGLVFWGDVTSRKQHQNFPAFVKVFRPETELWSFPDGAANHRRHLLLQQTTIGRLETADIDDRRDRNSDTTI